MWCEKILTHEVDMKDIRGSQVANEVFLVIWIYTLKILKRFQSKKGAVI
jgi:hypothetical protein